MNILIVDDSPTNRHLLTRFLKIKGHTVAEAENGQKAVDYFATHKPDLIVMDVMMPEMNGYEATKKIRELQGAAWVPVIFASALASNEEQIKGLDAGGDDYITKPINLKILQAKIEAKARIAAMHRELNHFYVEKQHELELATQLMSRMTRTYTEDNPALRYVISACTEFSGDFVVSKNLDDNISYTMLGDVTGHGLAAAITSIPALEEFYYLVEHEDDLSALVRRLNEKMHSLLPTQFYIAAIIIRMDTKNKRLEVWNGGMAEALLIDSKGGIEKRFASVDLPLGIMNSSVFKAETMSHEWASPKQLFCHSDGLTEAVRSDGEQFGTQRLELALKSVNVDKRFNKIQHDLKIFMQGLDPHDDVSLLALDLK